MGSKKCGGGSSWRGLEMERSTASNMTQGGDSGESIGSSQIESSSSSVTVSTRGAGDL